MYVLLGGGGCPDNAALGHPAGALCVCGGEGEGEGKVVEQQTGALGNPCSSFSSSSPSLCVRRGFDKNFTLGSAVQGPYRYLNCTVMESLVANFLEACGPLKQTPRSQFFCSVKSQNPLKWPKIIFNCMVVMIPWCTYVDPPLFWLYNIVNGILVTIKKDCEAVPWKHIYALRLCKLYFAIFWPSFAFSCWYMSKCPIRIRRSTDSRNKYTKIYKAFLHRTTKCQKCGNSTILQKIRTKIKKMANSLSKLTFS